MHRMFFVESKNQPICNVPKMTTGNRPADGGHLIIEAEDYEEFIKKNQKQNNILNV